MNYDHSSKIHKRYFLLTDQKISFVDHSYKKVVNYFSVLIKFGKES